jgi:hypothetical protein
MTPFNEPRVYAAGLSTDDPTQAFAYGEGLFVRQRNKVAFTTSGNFIAELAQGLWYQINGTRVKKPATAVIKPDIAVRAFSHDRYMAVMSEIATDCEAVQGLLEGQPLVQNLDLVPRMAPHTPAAPGEIPEFKLVASPNSGSSFTSDVKFDVKFGNLSFRDETGNRIVVNDLLPYAQEAFRFDVTIMKFQQLAALVRLALTFNESQTSWKIQWVFVPQTGLYYSLEAA